ncbi:hypothetical protein [Nonomuraea sp. NPDC050643]|uniref:hypothetical protein n=1 Tax=Nonomuraea sp. NPDC050643 TaxID=3155660 RepID=UPI0033FDC1BF
MTDRHAAYIVTLNKDLRVDDAEKILDALEMIKGVVSVEPVVADVMTHIAERRVNWLWQQALHVVADMEPEQIMRGTTA